VADWIDNLDSITATAGIAAFTGIERAMMEAEIKSQLAAMFGAFNVTFNTTSAGSHERINFGAYSATAGSLGVAPLDFMNLFTHGNSESGSARVFTNNFGFFIEPADSRNTILSELATAIAGTGAHELSHALGTNHHHAYGNASINPASYSNTGGVQNTSIQATGTTGLDEEGRERPRTFSQWSNLMLEAAGGGNTALRFAGGTPLATTVLPEVDSFSGADVGDSPAAATPLMLTFLPISGLHAANTVSSLGNDSDVDVYEFNVLGPSKLLADVWSTSRYGDDFNSLLRLLDTDGTTVLAFNDNTTYAGNAYNNGAFQSFDSNLLNISLPAAGTYFLEVSSAGNFAGAPGGLYNLVFGVATIPEARAWLMMGLACVAAGMIHAIRRHG
jgi:hypothetical protein